ncbi:glycoside hydrolase family 93 protein [Coleophoma cylindrospora]|uniref:Glycoside hydrolase family 93 protein n=1 Tax=Coleophoma cylindrospora TaxID=1849047 RepID=A0A3D8SF45_9HELO|nr:glycoside hydrolase family 93 protein [Coleophoma cylindrospora]
MWFHTLFSISLLSVAVSAVPYKPGGSSLKPFSTFSNVTIFTPPANYTDPRTLYARTVELENGVLLATWENYSPEPPLVYFPIYKSTDGGETWKMISKITDQVNGWGLRYQPFLYELPVTVGNFSAGTILAAGNSIPTDLSLTQIDIYASRDKGYTWEFVSKVADGGAAIPDNGIPAIWEPFLFYYKGEIICYYSDQRNPLYGQNLVHTTSSDLVSWAPIVPDVEYSTYTARPGMTTVTHLPNGSYIMTYEYGGGPDWGNVTDYEFPVYYRISDSPLTFNESIGHPVVANGIHPTSSPYVTWSPIGGPHGTILVSSGSLTQIFLNTELGAVDAWKVADTPASVSYTRSLRVFKDHPNHVLIAGGGKLPPSTTNKVTVSVIDLEQTLAQAK